MKSLNGERGERRSRAPRESEVIGLDNLQMQDYSAAIHVHVKIDHSKHAFS